MPKIASRFALGVFFSVAFVMLVVVMLWLTGWFGGSDTETYVCYFNESVQGLTSGSDVRYRGVPVGTIRSIKVAEDGRLVEVVMDIERDFPVSSDIAARVDFMGITGLRIINLRTAEPEEMERPELSFDSEYPVIPVMRSQMEVLDVGLERVIEILAQIDAKTINDRTIELLENLNAILDREMIESAFEDFDMIAADLDTMIGVYTRLGRSLERLSLSLETTAPDLAADLGVLADDLHGLLARLDEEAVAVEDIVHQAGLMVSDLRRLVQTIGDHAGEMILTDPREDEWPE
ncbi:MCE family protein [Candidatus Fermentibacterales bacterium]|nr:MCE family protein [Candidatus Fermentibacterales bacterium]